MHHLTKRFYSPVLVSAVKDEKELSFNIYLTSDLLQPKDGKINWNLWDLDGNKIESDTFEVKVIPRKNIFIKTIKLKEKNYKLDIRNILVDINVEISGKIVSSNIVFFVRPKYLQLRNPEISYNINSINNTSYEVIISSAAPALWVWPELNNIKTKYSDRFFHIFPNRDKKVILTTESDQTVDEIKNKFIIKSIIDTYE